MLLKENLNMLSFCTNSFSAFPSHSGKKLRLSHWPILSSASLLLFPTTLFLFTLLQPYQQTAHSHVFIVTMFYMIYNVMVAGTQKAPKP